jgi:hypothetical protein
LDDADIKEVLLNLVSRKRFNYGIKDLIEYIWKCLCLRRNLRSLKKKHRLFEKCEEKLDKELDVVHILKIGRQFKILSQILLDQRQKVMARFQRRYLVDTSSSSEESEYESKLDIVRSMDSSDPYKRLGTFGKLKQIVNSYKDHNLDSTDKRILRGLYIKKLKDFDEHQLQIRRRKMLY